ncbi:MEMO1 family protein [Spathaspora sp. JA1]|nr:MEMO1 family protein [Spathaspora sp. JA1]
MNVRSATHAGSWYSNNPTKLRSQLDSFFERARGLRKTIHGPLANESVSGARILIGPHAGFAYSGERLAETFTAWDTSKVKRVFLLGPSHHIYYKNYAMVSSFDSYETPFGDIPVDTETIETLIRKKSKYSSRDAVFKLMSEDIDEDEHSFEMHAPFIYYRGESAPLGMPKIIPIMISGMDDKLSEEIVESLLPYMEHEENHFIISSDFCHWGSRFGYTKYLTSEDNNLKTVENNLHSLGTFSKPKELEIYKSIELLDRMALDIATTGSSSDWKEYIKATGNTICGQKPISIVLSLVEEYHKKAPRSSPVDCVFNWIGYSQSNPVRRSSESSVSYASGFVQL